MCSPYCLKFIEDTLTEAEAKGKSVIESGARDVNGSARTLFDKFGPASYISTDLFEGRGVDQVCDAVDLVKTFGASKWDCVVSTEVLEHVRDWQAVISNYKRLLKPGGLMWITTRSRGFVFHEYPEDHWRFSLADMTAIFADFEIVNLNDDPFEPGVFIKARRPKKFKELTADQYAAITVWSIDAERASYGQ